jgi:hypothetical protein
MPDHSQTPLSQIEQIHPKIASIEIAYWETRRLGKQD